jgi:hypothetical protein
LHKHGIHNDPPADDVYSRAKFNSLLALSRAPSKTQPHQAGRQQRHGAWFRHDGRGAGLTGEGCSQYRLQSTRHSPS